MRALPVAIALLSSLAILAGCLQASKDPASSTPPGTVSVSPDRLPDPHKELDFATVVVGDHGAPYMHSIRALHHGSFLLERVGWNPLVDKKAADTAGTGWGAAGLWTHYACVAQFAGTGGLAIVDIADPTKPTVLSQADDPLVNGDCQFSQDGGYLFAGAYLGPGPNPKVGETYACPSGCPGGGGINVWDVHDKANPRHILYTDTGTYHTLQVHTDPRTNTTYVVQAYSGNIYRFDPQGPTLTLVNTITPMDHDMWIAQHPISHKWLLYSGAGPGFVIYDFDDPANPVPLANWQPKDDPGVSADDLRTGCCGWHRQATVDQLIDGKAIAVVAGEACGAGYTLPYFIMDVTDPTAPKVISKWELPGKPVSKDPEHLCEMSPHEFSVHDGYVVTGNYHAGVWLFDIGTPERLRHPVTLGYYIPDQEPATQSGPSGAQDLTFPWNPFVWGAFFDDRGYVLAGDFSSGVYMLKVPGLSK